MRPLSVGEGLPAAASRTAKRSSSLSGRKKNTADAARTSKAPVRTSGAPPVTSTPTVFIRMNIAAWTVRPNRAKTAASMADRARIPPLTAYSGE